MDRDATIWLMSVLGGLAGVAASPETGVNDPERPPRQCRRRNAACLLDHLISLGDERCRHVETERLCCLEVDDKPISGRQFEW